MNAGAPLLLRLSHLRHLGGSCLMTGVDRYVTGLFGGQIGKKPPFTIAGPRPDVTI
jgi:hypothetical protein